jgi:Bacterial protein of unknown function (DUF882)
MVVRALALIVLACGPAWSAEEALSKKAAFLKDKAERRDTRLKTVGSAAAAPVITLHNVWTNESVPVPVGGRLAEPRFDELARCHYTNQVTTMDQRLVDTVLRAAHKFGSTYVEIVSGFRAPKYQLMLRKKGHEVARDSEHPRGHAVDFRLPGIATKKLLRFVRSLHLGGVGYYPDSAFVHADVGPVRFWRGH